MGTSRMHLQDTLRRVGEGRREHKSCCLVLYRCLQCLISQSHRNGRGRAQGAPRARLSRLSSATCLKSFQKAKIKKQEKELAANAQIEMKSVQGKDPCSDLRPPVPSNFYEEQAAKGMSEEDFFPV